MLALDPRVVEAVWFALEPVLPQRPAAPHPLGCHRPRIPDRDCFIGVLWRLVTGCSWDVAGRMCGVSETTLRRRRTEWVDAGAFAALVDEAIAAYDRIIGLRLEHVAIDTASNKAPAGGEATGPSYIDRRKLGWKWSIATGMDGIPIGWVIDGAHRHDSKLVEPTLDAIAARGFLADIDMVHLDRAYQFPFVHRACAQRGLEPVIPAKRPWGKGQRKQPLSLALRWPVERTNSWLTNFGQLRRNTDRYKHQRTASLEFAIALIITVKLVKWADRWNG